MAEEPTKPIRIFYSYAYKDRLFRDELEKHLIPLKQMGWISSWHDREINGATEWEYEIDQHLNSADIILLLISPDFMASDYCYGIEMERAIERHERGEAVIIPIILRPVYWRGAPIGKLPALPSNGKPVTTWRSRDEAFRNVVTSIDDVVRRLLPRKIVEQQKDKNDVEIFVGLRENKTATLLLQEKIATCSFDVFLCHNNKDKPEVKKIGEQLKKRGILPWLDEWELRPGFPWQRLLEEQIEQIKSAAVFVGKDGVGPWQQLEMDAFLREFVNRGCPVIPVLLEYAPQEPRLPLFLRGNTWVDFRKQDPNPFKQLIWGITGERDRL